jgi:hypothetical protein
VHALEPDRSSLEAAVRELQVEVSRLTERVAVLERRQAPATAPAAASAALAEPVAPAPPPGVTRRPEAAPRGQLDLSMAVRFGRLSVVMGGAFLLRALTESETLTADLGVALGLGYALVWVAFAARAARLGALSDATFHGFAASAIANPLLFEATTRFEALSAPLAALLTLVFGGALLAVSWRRSLRGLAWVAVTAALLTAGGLVFQTPEPWPFIAVLVIFTGAALALSYRKGWVPLRWSVALVMNALILGATLAFFVDRPVLNLTVRELVALQLLLAGTSLAVLAYVALARRLEMGLFEIGQAATSVGIALELAPRVLATEGTGFAVPGAIAAGLAALCYGLVVLRWRSDHLTNLAAYGGIASLLAVQGLYWLLPPIAAESAWVLIALAGAWLTRDSANPAMRVTAAALIAAAALSSGLVRAVIYGLGARTGYDWHPITAGALIALGAALVTYLAVRWRAGDERSGWRWTGPATALLIVFAWGAGAVLTVILAPPVAKVDTSAVDPGALAALRTAVLTVLIWVLAFLGRTRRRPELLWVSYATLGYAGLKVLIEDLPNGRPTTLFVTFVLVGSVLMLLPRLIRRPAAPAPAAPSGEAPEARAVAAPAPKTSPTPPSPA